MRKARRDAEGDGRTGEAPPGPRTAHGGTPPEPPEGQRAGGARQPPPPLLCPARGSHAGPRSHCPPSHRGGTAGLTALCPHTWGRPQDTVPSLGLRRVAKRPAQGRHGWMRAPRRGSPGNAPRGRARGAHLGIVVQLVSAHAGGAGGRAEREERRAEERQAERDAGSAARLCNRLSPGFGALRRRGAF